MDRQAIAARLITLMERLGMNASQFSDYTGISRSTLQGYIKGTSSIKVESLICICEKLQISADYILFGRDDLIYSQNTEDADSVKLSNIYNQLDEDGRIVVLNAAIMEMRRMRNESQDKKEAM